MALLAAAEGPWRFAVAPFLFLAFFALFHDAAHGAYGLPNRVNDALLFVAGAPLLLSTHAQRHLHLRHHARPMADDDVEGLGARASLLGALMAGPVLAPRMHIEGARGVPPRLRRQVAAEHARSALIVGLALLEPTGPLGAVVLVALVLQLTIGAWASHIPHHPPRWFLALGARLRWLKTPVLLSALHHREHHARPKVPARELTPVITG
jgi:fatty acid desaturase